MKKLLIILVVLFTGYGLQAQIAPVDYEYVEIKPYFTGGMEGFQTYLEENTIYPLTAVKSGINGQVWIEFIIKTDGTIDKNSVKVIESLQADCDNEALRVIRESPKWVPGHMLCTMEDVPVKMKVAVTFKSPEL